MQTVTSLNSYNNISDYYLNRNIVVSLDDKYVGVLFEETGDKILVKPDENESHVTFEIPKCKVMMWSQSTNKKLVLDLEYVEITNYKTKYQD